MHGACHSACVWCFHVQSRWKRPHQVLGSPWARSAIWREWKHRPWEESKTVKVGQYLNQQGVGNETRFSKDNWESTYFNNFENPETDLDIAGNACCIDSADTRLSKDVHWLSNSKSIICSMTYYVCKNTVEFDIAVGWVCLPNPWIHLQVAPEFQIHWELATIQNAGWMDHRQVCHRGCQNIPILDPVDVETAYSYSALRYHCQNYMFNHIHGVMWASGRRNTQGKEDLYFAGKFVWQKLAKYFGAVTPTTGMILLSLSILEPFCNLQWFRTWDKWMDINPEDETYYTTQNQEVFLNYMENAYCAEYTRLSIIKPKRIPSNNLFSPQWLRDLVNHLLIHMICAVMMQDTSHIKMWLKHHPDEAIAPHAYWKPHDSIWICRLSHQKMGGKLIWILLITTKTLWWLAVHFGYQIPSTGVVSKRKHTRSMLISLMWHTAYCLSYQRTTKSGLVFPLAERSSAGVSHLIHVRPFAKQS